MFWIGLTIGVIVGWLLPVWINAAYYAYYRAKKGTYHE